MWRRSLLVLFLSLLCLSVESRLPEIDSVDVTKKLDEIMKVHVSYKKPNKELMRRTIQNFLEELDPAKTYFIRKDVQKWLDPSDDLLDRALNGYSKSDFTLFWEIYQKMGESIERRNSWMEDLERADLPENVKVSEFKDLDWAHDEDALFQRLLRMKTLQMEAAQKLDEKNKEGLLRRIEKRRANLEQDLQTKDPTERKRRILSYVLKALASALDSHTVYFTPGEATQFMINIQQRLFGIGAQLRDDLNGFTIVKIIEGGPAYRQKGLKVKDRVIAVDGEPVVGMSILEAVELIRGEEGTNVLLTVLRKREEKEEEEKIDINVVRGEVVIEESRIQSSYEPYGDGVIAEIKLFSFYQDPQSSSSADLLNEILKFKKEHNLKGIILDLRYNSGGVLSQAVEVAGLFVRKGIIVSIKDGEGSIQHLRDLDGKVAWDGPLIILTNRASASAAEIVAQSLQDYGRALIVGDDRTFGKGTFQTFTLDASLKGTANPEGEYKVTRGQYYTVSGKSPQLSGVEADITVPGIFSEFDIGEAFAKYPLQNDRIKENYDDDLADVPKRHREQLSKLYKFNLQKQTDEYVRHVPALKKNSQIRVQENKNYQNFLAELKKKNVDEEEMEEYGLNDLQMGEVVNIMKDLVILMRG